MDITTSLTVFPRLYSPSPWPFCDYQFVLLNHFIFHSAPPLPSHLGTSLEDILEKKRMPMISVDMSNATLQKFLLFCFLIIYLCHQNLLVLHHSPSCAHFASYSVSVACIPSYTYIFNSLIISPSVQYLWEIPSLAKSLFATALELEKMNMGVGMGKNHRYGGCFYLSSWPWVCCPRYFILILFPWSFHSTTSKMTFYTFFLVLNL